MRFLLVSFYLGFPRDSEFMIAEFERNSTQVVCVLWQWWNCMVRAKDSVLEQKIFEGGDFTVNNRLFYLRKFGQNSYRAETSLMASPYFM